jgi:hypothetical protein
MNTEKRWRCPDHPNATIGATLGEPEPMRCPRLMCGRAMESVEQQPQPARSMPDDPRQHQAQDRRARRPPRPESKPL